MNKKNIKNHLNKKIDDWIGTIEDENLQSIIRDNVIVTGGCIVSLLNGEEPHDYDIYFKTKDAVKAVAEYYVEKFNKTHGEIENKIGYKTRAFVLDGANKEECIAKGEGWDWGSAMLDIPEDRVKIIIRSDGVAEEKEEENIEGLDPEDLMERGDMVAAKKIESKNKNKYRPVFLSPNAITLSDGVQLVIRFYGSTSKIHENFDYIHCTSSYNYYLRDLTLPSEALTAIINKELVYSGSKYPVASIVRLRKFLKRGWHINAGQILKMSFQISQLNLTDPVVLEEQLVGVDTMYFKHIIETIESDMAKNENFEVSNEYFLSIVDKVFG